MLDEHQSRSRDTSPQGQNRQISSIPRLLQRDKWSKGKDGFLVPNFQSGEVGCFALSTPVVWNQQTEEYKYLCVYQHKGITIVMLVPASSLANGEQDLVQLKKQFLENVGLYIFLLFLHVFSPFGNYVFVNIKNGCTGSTESYSCRAETSKRLGRRECISCKWVPVPSHRRRQECV